MVRQAHHVLLLSHHVLLLFLVLFFPRFAVAQNIIDLTHPFNETTGFRLEKVFRGYTKQGYYTSSNKFCAPEHGGTHIDAPIHFAKGRRTVDQIPVDQLLGEAFVIDLRKKIGDEADYLIGKEDILEWEIQHGPIDSTSIVLFNTGWKALHSPGLSKKAAQYLVSKKIKGVGMDTPSLDSGSSKDFIAHRILLEANIYGLENVANLDLLPPRGNRLLVAPMKIEGGTGAPVRLFVIPAVVGGNDISE